jgi:hypothetical protein
MMVVHEVVKVVPVMRSQSSTRFQKFVQDVLLARTVMAARAS